MDLHNGIPDRFVTTGLYLVVQEERTRMPLSVAVTAYTCIF